MTYNISIGWQKYDTEFNGHPVSMEIRPLKNSAMITLTPYLGKAETIKEDGKNMVEAVVNMYDIQRIAKDILPDHVKNITGLTVNNEPPTPETLADESMLSSLVLDIIGKLSLISQLTREDEKNFAGLSNKETSEGNTSFQSPGSLQATG